MLKGKGDNTQLKMTSYLVYINRIRACAAKNERFIQT